MEECLVKLARVLKFLEVKAIHYGEFGLVLILKRSLNFLEMISLATLKNMKL